MTQRVGVEFDGNSRGAVNASRQAAAGIAQVKREAVGARPQLQGLEHDLARATRGALAGSGAFRGLGRSIAFASAGFLGGFGLAAAVRGAADELVNQVKVGAQVNAILRTTGGVAGVTAKHMDELAKAQLRKTGADDELVKKAGAVLLTFRNVRDVAGKGNDVFDRAIKLSGDLSVIFGSDLPSAALQLGKALQEPTTGLTALRRAGVTFSEQQRAQIKNLVEHNHLLEAQKIILREVERQVGGTAEKVGQVAPWMRLRETIKNLSATAITPLLPEIDRITKRVQAWADELASNSATQQRFKHDVEEGIGVAKDLVKVADKVSGALGGWKNTMEILLALKVVSVLAGWTTAIRTLIGTEAVAGAASTASGIAGAAGAAGLLRARLAALAKLGPITVTIALALIPKVKGNQNTSAAQDWFEGLPIVGGLFSQANRLANAGNQALGITSTPVPSGGTAGRVRRPGESSLTGGLVSVAAGANRKGVALKPHVVAFVSDLSAEIGSPLTITTGTNHNEYVLGSGNVSQHWTGDAADIAASGDWLTRLGQAALRVAGADPAWAAKQGGGAFTVGGVNILFNTNIGGNHFNHLHVGLTSWSGRQLPGGEKTVTPAGAKPPTSGGATPASTNALPGRIRQAISAAGVAVAAAALTPGKADDKAAVAQQRAALDQEIAWLRAKLKTNLGTEKRITLEDLLAGALGDLAGLQPGTKKKAGASISTITSLRTSVNEALRNLPTTLDDVEQQAVTKLQSLRDHLKVGLSAKDLAATRAGIRHWGNVLKDEIAAQAKIAADAAQEATRLWQRSWQNDVDRILRDFRENVVQKQLDDFDRETQRGIARLAAAVQTPEEKALADFQASRAATEKAKRRADIEQQINDTKAQLAALGVTTATGPLGDVGALIDIATGTRTGVSGATADAASVVDQQKQLTQQLLDLQEQYHQLQLDDQQQALQDAADASRRAADDKANADQQAYQDQRAAQRQSLQDMLDDQATALTQNLEDWNLWLEAKKKSWAEFVAWLQANGFSTAGLTPPAGTGAGASGAASEGAIPRALVGHAIPFADGGTVPGLYIGRRDTVMARLTPGEHVIDRQLSDDLRDFLASGGSRGGPVLAVFKINDRELARAIADPLSAEQARQIGYTIQRG